MQAPTTNQEASTMAGTDNPTRKLTATLPDGTVATRKTPRTYTHVLAAKNAKTGVWYAHSWCGRPDLAAKALNQLLHGKYSQPGTVAQVVPVDGTPTLANTATAAGRRANSEARQAAQVPAECAAMFADPLGNGCRCTLPEGHAGSHTGVVRVGTRGKRQVAQAAVAKVGPVALPPVATDADALHLQLAEHKGTYKAYCDWQALRAKALAAGDTQVAATLKVKMDSVRPAYRAYRKAAAQLRELKKGAAPAAPATPTQRGNELALAAAQGVHGKLVPGTGSKGMRVAFEASAGAELEMDLELAVAKAEVWHYGKRGQWWGSMRARNLSMVRQVVRQRHNLRSTRGMWFTQGAPKHGTSKVDGFRDVDYVRPSNDGPQGLKDMLRLVQ